MKLKVESIMKNVILAMSYLDNKIYHRDNCTKSNI